MEIQMGWEPVLQRQVPGVLEQQGNLIQVCILMGMEIMLPVPMQTVEEQRNLILVQVRHFLTVHGLKQREPQV